MCGRAHPNDTFWDFPEPEQRAATGYEEKDHDFGYWFNIFRFMTPHSLGPNQSIGRLITEMKEDGYGPDKPYGWHPAQVPR